MHRWFPARTSLGRDDDWACGGSTALWIDGDQGERSAHHFYAALKTSAAPYLRLRRLRTYGSRLARLRRLAGMTIGLVAAEPALWVLPPPSFSETPLTPPGNRPPERAPPRGDAGASARAKPAP